MIFLIVLAFATLCNVARARGGGAGPGLVLEGSVNERESVQHIDHYLDDGWTLTPQKAITSEAAKFTPLRGKTVDFGYTKSRVWLRARVQNDTQDISEWRLFFAENFKQIFDVYIIRGEGTASPEIDHVVDLDETSPFWKRPIQYAELTAPLELAPGESATVLISLWSEGSSYIEFSVLSVEDFQLIAATRTAKNFLFYGMIGLLITVALICLIIFQNPIFAAYCSYTLSAVLYVMHSDGVAFQWLWPAFPGFNSIASVFLGSGIIVFGAIFARMFLQPAKYHPWMDKLLIFSAALPVFFIVVLLPLDGQILKKILVMTSLFGIANCAIAGFVAARHRFREVRFYVFGWVSVLLSALMLNLDHIFGVDLTQDFILDSMRAVMVFDAAMLGLAIADRNALLRESQRNALQQSLDNATRNLELNNRLGDLEQRYTKAVAQSRSRSERIRDTVHDLQQPLHALRLKVQGMSSGTSGGVDAETLEGAFVYLENLVSTPLEQPDGNAAEFESSHEDRIRNERMIALSAVLRTLHAMFREDAETRGLDLVVDFDGLDADVDGFAAMRVLSNLVQNAIKYTSDGVVKVTGSRNGNIVRVQVCDDGPGMTRDAFEAALGREVRLDEDMTGDAGHGLGLAIVRELCRRQSYGLSLMQHSGSGTCIEIAFDDKSHS